MAPASPLIDRIFLRAQDKEGKWGSFSLRDLIDMGKGDVALSWVVHRLAGYHIGEEVTPEQLEEMASILQPGSYVAIKDDQGA